MTHSAQSQLWIGVERFHRALSIAVSDYDIESQGHKIRHYFDTDVLLKTINGLLDHDPADFSRTSYPLVRTFFALGCIGPACVLRPHALELLRKLRMPSPFVQVLYQDKLRKAMESTNLFALRDTIHSLIRQKDSEKRRTQIINTLKTHGTRALMILELSNGTRDERLRRLRKNDLLRTIGSEPSIHMALSHRLTAIAATELASTRAEKRSNNLRDACALATLSDYIQRGNTQLGTPLVRFYTETLGLQRLIIDNEKVAEHLSYTYLPVPITHQYENLVRSVLRDADYYVVRSFFRAIAIPASHFRQQKSKGSLGNSEGAVADIVPTLSELRTVVDYLGSLLATQNVTKDSLENVRIGERTLLQAITDFRSLALLDSGILSSLQKGNLIDRIDPSLSDLFDLITPLTVHQQVRRDLRKIVDALNKHVQSWQEWQAETDDIAHVVELRHTEMRGSTGEQVPDVMRDLGLIRWGVDLLPTTEAKIRDSFEELTSKNAGARSLACGALAAQLAQPSHIIEDVTVASALLWLFRLHRKLYLYIDKCYGSVTPPTSILLMRNAAELMGNTSLAIREKERLIQSALAAVQHGASKAPENALEPAEWQARYWLGIGYIYYHAWLSEVRFVSISRPLPQDLNRVAKSWLLESFEAGKRVIALARHRQLTWAFGVNHCAYVGTEGDFDQELVANCIKELLALRGDRSLWNYRFHDTCAWQLAITAQRVWSAAKKKGLEFGDQLKFLLELLSDAENEYRDLEKESCFGDLVPQRHSMELKQFKKEVIANRLGLVE